MVDVGDPHAPMTGYSPDHAKVAAGRRALSGRWSSPTGQVCHLKIFVNTAYLDVRACLCRDRNWSR